MFEKFLKNMFLLMEEADPEGGSGGTGEPDVSLTDDTPPAETATTFNDFIEKLPEDLKDNPSLKLHKNFETLAKSYVHAQKQIGSDKLVVPSEHATDEDWRSAFHKLGLPENKDDYKISLGKDASITEDFSKMFAGEAHKIGILPKQANALLNWYDGLTKSQLDEQQTNYTNTQKSEMDKLKSAWGEAYEDKYIQAQNVVKDIGGDDMKLWLEETGLNKNPEMIKFMAKVSEGLGEDKFRGDGNRGGGLTKQDAQEKINSIYGDANHPYNQAGHPSHNDAVAEMQKLFTLAN